MMATVLLSQHSSNPLEVPSSDINNSKQLRQIETAGGLVSSDDNVDPFNFPAEQNHRSLLSQWNPKMTHASSKKSTVDDNVDPFNFPVQNHRSLLSQWNPKMTHALSKKSTVGNMSPPHMVDLDEDMSDGETQPLEAEDVCCDDGSAYQNEEDEDEEEKSIFLKPPDEREQIREEILDLEEAVPQLGDEYKIIDRLGTGTFSSVYKAIDLWHHTKWDNTLWHGFHPPESSAHYHRQNWSKVFVAIKRIYVTSGPERIRNELSVMEDCRGCRHVSQLVTAFRHHDQVVAVMPYHRNEDFRDYYRLLSLDGMRAYLRCMFRALRDVHSRGVIHRDVKPANFLFDPHTGIGTLCDFGLACRMEPGPTLGACLHTGPSPEAPHGRIKPRTDYDPDLLRQMRKEANYRSTQQSEKVGYPDKDTRPHSKANRAGTRGFRAPEVLLKCGEQSGAIDVWSTGIIFLFFLTAKFPLFQSSDDIEALMELATIFGRRRMERTATLHSRTFATNLPSVNPEGISWSEFVQRLNPNLMVPRKPDTRFYPYSNHVPTGITAPPPSSSSSSPPPSFHSSPRSSSTSTSKSRPVLRDSSPSSPTAERHKTDMLLALDLVEKLLDPDATKRPTPREVLNHSFLSEDDEGIDDDDYFPQPFGGGVCGEWHFYDETTGEPCVQVKLKDETMDVKRLVSGEGIAIGRQPCEFHSDYFDPHFCWMRYGITQELLIDLDFNVEYPVKAPLMRLPDEVSSFLEQLYPLFPQILPLAVVILSPVFVLYLANSSTLSWQISMVFDSLGSLFSWSSSRDSSTSSDSAERKRLRKRPVRTRAEQVAVLNGDAAYAYPLTPKERDSEGYYPGLVNLSGTYCFLNATLQALASLSYLQPHIEDIHARAVALNIATPVIDPLRYMLKVLNTPRSYPKAERPIELIAALSTDPSGRRNPLLYSREHQDAQELFQLVSESIKREITAVDKESLRDRGLGGIYGQTGHPRLKDVGKTVFDGLTANRRSCVVCGYTEAVMHFAFDNWQLAVPRVAACHLMDCLFDYTRLEKLTDCICQKCSMLATYQKLLQEAERLTALTSVDPTPSSSKKKRSRDARKLEARVKAALEQGRIEEDIPGVKLEKVYSRESTKQAMIARPPPVLALHLNRSVHHGHYAAKNVCYVEFPEFLDLTPFTTSGQLSTAPTVPISSPSQSPSRSLTPTPPNINAPRTYYRLSAVVCHYGQHSYGHYICYRRKPRSPAAGANRFLPPKLACPWTCECDKCSRFGNVRMDDDFDVRRRHGQGWLRISDETVQECGIETVLQEGSAAFMLFYEKILQHRSSFNPPSQALRGSEETVRPKDVQDNGSSITLVDSERARTNEMARSQSPPGKLVRPRVVRNVSAARRSKSPSYPPSAPSASYQRESLPQPSTMNGNTTKTQQNGHGSNGSARPPPESNSTSWYQNSANSRSRASSSATPHTSKNSVLQRTHQPSNSLQYQPQRLQT